MKEYDVSLVRSAWDQPQGLFDLVGMSFRLWRRNIGFIVKVLIWPSILVMIGTIGLNCMLSYAKTFAGDILKGVAIGASSLIIYCVGLIWLNARLMGLVRLTNGFAPDWPAAMKFARERAIWLVGLFFLIGAMTSFSVGICICLAAVGAAASAAANDTFKVLAIVLGVIAALLIFIIVCFLILFSSIMISVLACEDTSFFGVVGRTFRIMFQNPVRVIGFGLIMWVVLYAAAVPIALPVVLISAGDAAFRQMTGTLGSGEFLPSLWVIVVTQFWEALTQMVLRPVGFFAFGLLYLDLRHRADGLDIRRRLRNLKEQLLTST
ncbi:MAG: hypothetical protein K2W95_25920 [Candidatus Obscuribacterales bacterium]|nr:hypothetical protein [Candidatus Obscuribacterales bacterium]